jgi:predicted secreted protein
MAPINNKKHKRSMVLKLNPRKGMLWSLKFSALLKITSNSIEPKIKKNTSDT